MIWLKWEIEFETLYKIIKKNFIGYDNIDVYRQCTYNLLKIGIDLYLYTYTLTHICIVQTYWNANKTYGTISNIESHRFDCMHIKLHRIFNVAHFFAYINSKYIYSVYI